MLKVLSITCVCMLVYVCLLMYKDYSLVQMASSWHWLKDVNVKTLLVCLTAAHGSLLR